MLKALDVLSHMSIMNEYHAEIRFLSAEKASAQVLVNRVMP